MNIVGALLAKKFLPKKFRFFKRINVLPGVTLNLSHKGHSVSVGPRHARVTWHNTGGKRTLRSTIGIPHTGIYKSTVHITNKKPRLKKTPLNKP